MGQYRKSDLDMNRKVLADLAVHDPDAFEQIVNHVMA
jgi:large subunit ribosomal protein L20